MARTVSEEHQSTKMDLAEMVSVASEVVAAYVSKNDTRINEIPKVYESVYRSIQGILDGSLLGADLQVSRSTSADSVRDEGDEDEGMSPTPSLAAARSNVNSVVSSPVPVASKLLTPALAKAPINPADTISDDFLICLEDGKPMKTLKRYLKGRYNMTPEQYREKWGLPDDYPMTAPGYSKVRRELALRNRLGQVDAPEPEQQPQAAPKAGKGSSRTSAAKAKKGELAEA